MDYTDTSDVKPRHYNTGRRLKAKRKSRADIN